MPAPFNFEQGLKAGDSFAFVQGLYTWAGTKRGKRIGHIDGSCQIVSAVEERSLMAGKKLGLALAVIVFALATTASASALGEQEVIRILEVPEGSRRFRRLSRDRGADRFSPAVRRV